MHYSYPTSHYYICVDYIRVGSINAPHIGGFALICNNFCAKISLSLNSLIHIITNLYGLLEIASRFYHNVKCLVWQLEYSLI
jgi:hypothetical protein